MGLGSTIKKKLGGRDEREQAPGYNQSGPSNAGPYYVPPPGPPPGHAPPGFAPPGNGPGYPYPDAQAPYYQTWTAVPDTSELPPPPALRYDKSPTSNAPEALAEAADGWCQWNPLQGPAPFTSSDLEKMRSGAALQLVKPREFIGELFAPKSLFSKTGVWTCRSSSRCRDSCLTSDLPLYAARYHAPTAAESTTTIYYEVRILGIGLDLDGEQSSMAIGLCAQPYPTWRLPGWERGSLGVHGDDGRRYVNDNEGGLDFTAPFQAGETFGLGMKFTAPPSPSPPPYDFVSEKNAHLAPPPPSAQAPAGMSADVFFTRNGQWQGGWNLHEERDQALGGINGLEGEVDIYAAVGVFGGVDFEVIFDRTQWAYQTQC
ncbi:MAG: hypothetical protein M1815_002043 [Lichina confinis]|nr:MAG: hypothetical protein M1815_002043 [Lichina confinis]